MEPVNATTQYTILSSTGDGVGSPYDISRAISIGVDVSVTITTGTIDIILYGYNGSSWIQLYSEAGISSSVDKNIYKSTYPHYSEIKAEIDNAGADVSAEFTLSIKA